MRSRCTGPMVVSTAISGDTRHTWRRSPRGRRCHLGHEDLGALGQLLVHRARQAGHVVVRPRRGDHRLRPGHEVGDVVLGRGLAVGPGDADNRWCHLASRCWARSTNGAARRRSSGAASAQARSTRTGARSAAAAANGAAGRRARRPRAPRLRPGPRQRRACGGGGSRRGATSSPARRAARGRPPPPSRQPGRPGPGEGERQAGDAHEREGDVPRLARPPAQGKARGRARQVVLALGHPEPAGPAGRRARVQAAYATQARAPLLASHTVATGRLIVHLAGRARRAARAAPRAASCGRRRAGRSGARS